ncbi:uncharacterized protein F4807DRAFT_407074 [Annulohypoxylon truncatum]|uniref:uncharacterized protein n=1 Tax=Annulohypoxylon truncatum TaxID=327061 RepID=UPI0020075C86|nr:uncharacterized protein F4807DRAFT_407074 [Annulohypoxylon truncatum]KAI1214203.1 hypothetical protein F4807DRAFT_407074 [Annulohypoxylon truncatum]
MASTQWVQLPFALVTPGQVLSAGIVLPLVCIALVSIRFHIRRIQKTHLGIDDWLITLGVIFITGMGACMITGERLHVYGYPTPVPSGTVASEAYGLFLDAYIQLAKIQFAMQFLMCFAYGFVKASIIFFCRRIFLGHKNTAFDWASLVGLGLVTLWSVGFLFGLVFGCGKRVWLHWVPLQEMEESCDGISPEEAMVISDFILDIFLLILPIPSIWSLSMSTGRKWAVTSIFLVGLTSLAASAARMSIYLTVLYQGYGAGYDINRTASTMLWWTMLEVSLAAIAACLPTLSFLARDAGLRKIFHSLSSMTSLPSSWRRWSGSKSNKPLEISQDSLYTSSYPMGHVTQIGTHEKSVGSYQSEPVKQSIGSLV